jgi:hypothetical protein
VKFVRNVLRSRRAQRRLTELLAERPPLEPHRYRIGVYFADGKVNLYQLRQWYRPLARLAERHPVLILSRASGAALALLEESPLPVAYVRRVADLEQVIHDQDLHVVFYVNQNAKNFQMMRYGRRWHVFINHGESDKMYMTTNQFKAYDYALIAGDAARTRLEKVLWDYDFDKRAIPIGRPQADHYLDDAALPYTPDDRDVVLYAPTWEGDRGAAAYGSIASHGVALVTSLLASGRHRVIYRAWSTTSTAPRTGPSSRPSPRRTQPTRRCSTSTTTVRRSAGSWRRRMSRSSTSRRWSTTVSPRAGPCSSRAR